MRACRARLVPALGLVAITAVATVAQAQDSPADILPITTARIDQLMKGLAAEFAVWEPARLRDEQKMRDAEAGGGSGGSSASGAQARERFDRCSEPLVESDTAFQRWARTFQQKFGALSQPQMQAVGMRMDGYQKRLDRLEPDDKAGAAALQDSIRRVMFEVTGVPVAEQARNENRLRAMVEQKCGKEPPRARQRDRDDEQSQTEPQTFETDTLVSDAGLRASGLKPRQYTILRERVAAWLLASTGDQDIGDYVFTAAEKTALNQRAAALKKYATMLSSTGHWQFD